MNLTDYIPHGMIVAFGTVVSWIYREHVKQDDHRFDKISEAMKLLLEGQTKLASKIADNHADVLKLFITEKKG